MILGKRKLALWLSIFFVATNIINHGAYGATHQAKGSATTGSDNENQLRVEATQYEKDFAAGDAKAIASMCSPDCIYADADGNEYHGQEQIEHVYEDYFKKGGAKAIKVAIASITFPSPQVAIEQGVTTSLTKSGSSDANKYMVVHIKHDGKWSMYRVIETYCPPPMVESKLKDLSWMIGNWTANGAQHSLHMNAKYTNDQHFISCTFGSDSTSPTEEEVIAWDPRGQRIFSWHYGSDGGFGRAIWKQTPQGWTKRAYTIEADGTRGAATYTIQKTDNDTYIWRSTQRSLNGRQLPDTADVKVCRDAS